MGVDRDTDILLLSLHKLPCLDLMQQDFTCLVLISLLLLNWLEPDLD